MRWRSALLTASSTAALLAGCGGGEERLPVLTALRLATLADHVAAGRNCGAPLLAGTIGAVNEGQVPATLQEPLLAEANRIAATCSRSAARAIAERLRP